MTLSASSETKTIPHYIGGKPTLGSSSRLGDVYNPATGKVAAKVPLASRAEIDSAIAVAKAAFPGWAGLTPLRRARVMFKFKELIERHANELAAIVTSEHGKVLSDALGEVTRGLEVVEF